LIDGVKIFGSCLVKNEADIIEETLEHAVTWCDHIIVDDNGSEDETWSIVQRMAAKYPQIIAWRSKAQPYGNKLRGEPFRAFRHLSRPGDWWTRLDSDERYIDDPREFLAAVPRRHHVVTTAHFQYYFTDTDLAQWNDWKSAGAKVPPVHERLHYYRCDWSEIRFVRYRNKLVWPEGASWPLHAGVMHHRRLRVRHLQFRSPEQMQMRVNTRLKAIEEGCETFAQHRERQDWRDFMVPASCLRDDRQPDPWSYDESALPSHREPFPRLMMKYFMHGTGLWP